MPSNEASLLLVDDDPSAIQVMSRMLAGYPNQRFATTGNDALRLAREALPDLILLDADMPGMSGFEVNDALKSEPALARVPVIFATSHGVPELQVAALERGANDYVTKPLVAAQLLARVRACLRTTLHDEDLKRERLWVGAAQSQPGPRQPRLLIVDDDVGALQVLRHDLKDLGDLSFAKSGEEALRLARQLAPDLILLDARMPGIDGFEVCRTLKAEAAFKHVPIVFVTVFSDVDSEMRALDLGAADFIAKPYSAAVLQARVRNLFELKRRTDAELQSVREHWRRVGDARVADIVGAASDAIVSYDAAGQVVLANASACRMFGASHGQLIGQPVQALLGPGFVPPNRPVPDALRLVVARADAAAFAAEIAVSMVGDGPERLTTVVLRDVVARERLEAESRARAEAEAASRAKSLTLSCIAHEMGNPLHGMLGFADLMATDRAHPLAPAQARRLEHIVASGGRLQTLMRDLLDLGRFESGTLRLATLPTPLRACVDAAVVALSAQAALAGVTLTCPPVAATISVLADAGRLHQCLVNLISNAIKYGRDAGRVEIAATFDATEVSIAVRDDGLGIAPAQRAHLLEPFNRLGREDSAAPGAGLGLTITRQLVLAMAGRLLVASEPGLGSCFTVVLPRAPDGAATPADRAPARPA